MTRRRINSQARGRCNRIARARQPLALPDVIDESLPFVDDDERDEPTETDEEHVDALDETLRCPLCGSVLDIQTVVVSRPVASYERGATVRPRVEQLASAALCTGCEFCAEVSDIINGNI